MSARGRSKNLINFLDEENGEMVKKDSKIRKALSFFSMNLETFCGKVGSEPYLY